MEDFEEKAEKALDSAPTKPHVWYRNVDDTFMILHEYAIQEFTEHINSQSEHIKFTIEAEQDGQLPFLDTLVILNDDSTLKTKIYRKPTHRPILELGLQPPPGAQEVGSPYPTM